MKQNLQHRQRGVGIAELMVSMTIGLLVTLAVATLFLSTRKDYRENDATAKMQENVRFTLELLSNDLRHAGFFGNIPDPGDINVDTLTVAAPSVDCGATTASGKAGLYNFTKTHSLLSYGYQIADAGSFYGTCLSTSEVKANSNILIIKRVAGEPTAPLTDTDANDDRLTKTPYVYANGSSAVLYTLPLTTALPFAGGQHWAYQPRIYYIDPSNRLCRKQLNNLTMVSEPLADGIEAFHVEFGIDTVSSGLYDGAPGYFYKPTANVDPDTATDMDQAVSATIFVLGRTTDPDPDTNYRDTKTYQLGATGPTIPAANDRFHRRVYSLTVALKNIRNQVMSR